MKAESDVPRRSLDTCSRIGRHRVADRRRAGGFTLVEVLVALLVMAVMAGIAWRGVDGIVRTRDASQARLDRTLRLNTVVAQWEQDLMAIQDSAALPQSLTCDGATVRLARRTPTGLQIVAWSLRPDPAGANWVRWAGPAVTLTADLQQSWLTSQQLLGDEPGSIRALTGLSQWQVYFYQGNGWANCQSTGNLVASAASAASAASGIPLLNNPLPANRIALPSGVRLVLSFAPGSGIDGSLVRDTQIGP